MAWLKLGKNRTTWRSFPGIYRHI